MRIKSTLLIMTLCFLLMTTGCMGSADIDKKTILTLVLTDKKDNKYAFYVEFPNLTKSRGKGLL